MQQILALQQHNISYIKEGQGTVLVLLHGFGEDKDIWIHQLNHLKEKYLLITPDLPGTGNSSLIESDHISIENYADWLYNFLQQLITTNQKIILLGHSMGGYITLAYAKKYPETLAAFGLIHSSSFADSEEKKVVRKRAIETINQYGAFAFIKNTLPNLFSKQTKQEHYTVIDTLIEKGKNFTAAALVQYYQAMMNRNDNTEVLQNSLVPVLFVMGVEDMAAPMQDVLQQCHLPQKSFVHILENVAHMSMLEATEQLNKIIENFVDEIIV